MAPEVALKKEYSRSVDIWSTGIIMHMLLTGGDHPLFKKEDNAETYKNKLKNANHLNFPTRLSA
jgi:serine/threonine protein kinase